MKQAANAPERDTEDQLSRAEQLDVGHVPRRQVLCASAARRDAERRQQRERGAEMATGHSRQSEGWG